MLTVLERHEHGGQTAWQAVVLMVVHKCDCVIGVRTKKRALQNITQVIRGTLLAHVVEVIMKVFIKERDLNGLVT